MNQVELHPKNKAKISIGWGTAGSKSGKVLCLLTGEG